MRRAGTASLVGLAILLSALAVAAAPRRLKAVVVVDASSSMKKNDPDQLAHLAAKLLVDLADGRDELTIASFGSQARAVQTADASAKVPLHTAVDRIVPDEDCTDYQKGFELAARQFSGAPAPGERRLVVFLTDGQFHPVGDSPDKCGQKFDKLPEDERRQTASQVERAVDQLKQQRVKVFAIGLGTKLDQAKHSVALLKQAAKRSGGKFLEARQADQLPEFFADIFAALVGASVQKLSTSGARAELDVPDDSSHVHFVVRSDDPKPGLSLNRDPSLGSPNSWPFGKPPQSFRGPDLRLQQGKVARGYAVAWLEAPKPGRYAVVRAGGSGPLNTWLIADVGLSLRLEGLAKTMAETSEFKGSVALRSRGGKPVPLSRNFLDKVRFEVELPSQKTLHLPAAGLDQSAFDAGRLAPRDQPYRVTARATHDEGFLQVEPVSLDIKVIHQVALDVGVSPLRFDSMAEQGPIALAAPLTVRLLSATKPATDIELELQLPEGPARSELVLSPTSISFGPNKPSEVQLEVRFNKPEELRSTSRQYTGELTLVAAPQHRPLLSGKHQWSGKLDGQLRSWTLRRWLEEYQYEIGIGLFTLVMLVWLIGRMVARKFPRRARIHHTEVGQDFESTSLIQRFARHGAYRSARFKYPLGKRARPMVWFRSTGAGFQVIPEKGTLVTIVQEGEPEERAREFRGAWDQTYRLGDRYEVRLTRS